MGYNPLNRRNFLKLSSVGVVSAAASKRVRAQETESAEQDTTGVAERTLGRTGLKVSVIGFGAMRTSESAVMRAAFDRGVNWLDTARAYMDGKNERICGEALKGYRDRVRVTTKTGERSKRGILRDVERSLKSLQTDYVDLLLLHIADKPAELTNQETREALEQVRKEGKVRFVGVSTHNEAEILDAVAQDPDKFFDVVLARYNFRSPKSVKEAIARAAKAGIGVIAMKTQAGGYKTDEMGDISPHQAALKWVLQDQNVTFAIPAMVNLDQVKENTEVMGMKLSSVDKQILSRYGNAIAPYHCLGCKECDGTCPNRVDIAEVNRCLMYAEGYGDIDLARSVYAGLPPAVTAAVCGDCPECVAQCPNGVRIADRMQAARILFA